MPPEPPFAPDVEVHLKVFGDFDPDEFTRVTGLVPTRTRRRGALAATPRLGRATEDSWRLILGPVATMGGTEQIATMVGTIEPVLALIRKFQADHNLTMQLTFVAYVTPHRATAVPNIALDHEFLERLAATGAGLDFDITLLAADEEAVVSDGPST
jgi:hypothetical protein